MSERRSPDARCRPAVRSAADRDALVRQWSGIPSFVVWRLYSLLTQNGVPPDDAEQEGYLALLRAAELWEEGRGVQFNSYAIRAVTHRVYDFCTRDRLVHVPRHPPLRYAAQASRALTVRDIDDCANSLAVDDQGARGTRFEADEYERLRAAVRQLPEAQRRVIALRYDEELTLAAAGRRLGVSRERVRQVQAEALRSLRALMGVAA